MPCASSSAELRMDPVRYSTHIQITSSFTFAYSAYQASRRQQRPAKGGSTKFGPTLNVGHLQRYSKNSPSQLPRSTSGSCSCSKTTTTIATNVLDRRKYAIVALRVCSLKKSADLPAPASCTGGRVFAVQSLVVTFGVSAARIADKTCMFATPA